MNIIKYSFAIALIIATGPSWGQIYKTVDEHGNISYSDKPSKQQKSELVNLPELNRSQAMDLKNKPKAKAAPFFKPVYRLYLLSPKHQSHLTAGLRDLSVEAKFEVNINSNSADQSAVNQALANAKTGLKIELLHNGKLLASSNGKAKIKEIPQGTHKLQARLRSATGATVATSESATIYVHRPSSLLRQASADESELEPLAEDQQQTSSDGDTEQAADGPTPEASDAEQTKPENEEAEAAEEAAENDAPESESASAPDTAEGAEDSNDQD
ncbi:MAG: DUF4124 domain-containing protein [Cellvibrionaceae bacterium]|nr:DUF4124 domain-containing protein [Cellvibrionaceae bacterium]MCV6624667.1 DUF4124 domain-containing protein [Cellvibrionaceae bacterium]